MPGLRLGQTLKYAIPIADALTRAHAAGIVHRDLKPSDIMVDVHGVVRLLDFGLAELTEAAPSGTDESTRTVAAMTEQGVIIGTAAYMSPEQAQGKPVDARSDIFSFGAVLYEMVTGRRAFKGDSAFSTLAEVVQREVAPLDGGPPVATGALAGLRLSRLPHLQLAGWRGKYFYVPPRVDRRRGPPVPRTARPRRVDALGTGPTTDIGRRQLPQPLSGAERPDGVLKREHG